MARRFAQGLALVALAVMMTLVATPVWAQAEPDPTAILTQALAEAGVTLETATPEELIAAVTQAIRANPALAAAITTVAIQAAPAQAVAITTAAIGAAPDQAAAITYAAVQAAPDQAAAIRKAAAAAVPPDMRSQFESGSDFAAPPSSRDDSPSPTTP